MLTLQGLSGSGLAWLSPDGTRIVTGDDQGWVNVCDTRRFRESRPPGPLPAVAPTP